MPLVSTRITLSVHCAWCCWASTGVAGATRMGLSCSLRSLCSTLPGFNLVRSSRELVRCWPSQGRAHDAQRAQAAARPHARGAPRPANLGAWEHRARTGRDLGPDSGGPRPSPGKPGKPLTPPPAGHSVLVCASMPGRQAEATPPQRGGTAGRAPRPAQARAAAGSQQLAGSQTAVAASALMRAGQACPAGSLSQCRPLLQARLQSCALPFAYPAAAWPIFMPDHAMQAGQACLIFGLGQRRHALHGLQQLSGSSPAEWLAARST